MKHSKRAAYLIATLLWVGGASGAKDGSGKCASLVGKAYGPATVSSAVLVTKTDVQVEHCEVLAAKTGRPEFEMRALLPTHWAGVVVQGGGGGLNGAIPSAAAWVPVQPLNQGLVFVASNSGHKSDPQDAGKTLAANPEGMLDYSYRAIGTAHEFAAALVQHYYRRRPQKTYFIGCSRGGTEAMQAAAHYPDDYDGVVVQAPAPHMNAFVARVAGFSSMTPLDDAKWQAVYDAYITQCDELDRAKDGIVSSKSACKFDAASLPFLTSAELKTVQSITTDLKLADGTLINPGYWWGPQFAGVFAGLAELGNQWMRYPILNDPGYDPKSFDLERYWPRIVAANAPYAIDVDSGALASFLKRGKKMLVFMGLDDPTLSIDDTVSFQHQVQSLAGTAAANTQMYLFPGVGHCGGWPETDKLKGAESVDMLGVLRSWVEKGHRPAMLTAAHIDADGKVLRTRPICMTGSYPKYSGAGDVNEAASFTCQLDGT